VSDPSVELARFRRALDLFCERLEEDRWVLAAVLDGSLSLDTVWRHDSLHLWVVIADGTTQRRKADGDDVDVHRRLVEEGVDLYITLVERSRFRRMVEGQVRNGLAWSPWTVRTLLWSREPGLSTWFETANSPAPRDARHRRFAVVTWLLSGRRWARKLHRKGDLVRCRRALWGLASAMAAGIVLEAGEICEDDLLGRGLALAPQLVGPIVEVARDVTASPEAIEGAIVAADAFLVARSAWLDPLRDRLRAPAPVPLSELGEHFAYTLLHPWHLGIAADWLVERGEADAVSASVPLTKKSRIEVEEPAWLMI